MGKVVVTTTKQTTIDFSRAATKRAWDRAHAPWMCLLCGEYIPIGTSHRHYDGGVPCPPGSAYAPSVTHDGSS